MSLLRLSVYILYMLMISRDYSNQMSVSFHQDEWWFEDGQNAKRDNSVQPAWDSKAIKNFGFLTPPRCRSFSWFTFSENSPSWRSPVVQARRYTSTFSSMMHDWNSPEGESLSRWWRLRSIWLNGDLNWYMQLKRMMNNSANRSCYTHNQDVSCIVTSRRMPY
jgi:hypothetical protein